MKAANEPSDTTGIDASPAPADSSAVPDSPPEPTVLFEPTVHGRMLILLASIGNDEWPFTMVVGSSNYVTGVNSKKTEKDPGALRDLMGPRGIIGAFLSLQFSSVMHRRKESGLMICGIDMTCQKADTNSSSP